MPKEIRAVFNLDEYEKKRRRVNQIVKENRDKVLDDFKEKSKFIAPSVFYYKHDIFKKTINETDDYSFDKKVAKRNEYYTQFGEGLHNYIINYCNSLSLAKMIHHIASELKYNCNTIKISYTKDISDICGSNRTFYYIIDKLCEIKLLCKTNKDFLYVVNHNFLFKGDFNLFIKLYDRKYENLQVCDFYDEKGRIIIPDDYGK